MKKRTHYPLIHLLVLSLLAAACAVPPSAPPPEAAAAKPLMLEDIDLPVDPAEWTEWRNSLAPAGDPGPELTLAENGRSDWRIVLPDSPTSQDRVAADELTRWFEQMTGARLETVSESTLDDEATHLICLGRTKRLAATQTDLLVSDLKEEGYGIHANDGLLYLWGGTRRGSINAVFALLEEDLGCRWFGDGHNPIPSHRTLRFRPMMRTYTPQLRLRDPFYEPSFDAEWSLRNRTNAPGAKVPGEAGGRIEYAGGLWVHTVARLLPPAEYFADHPDYYMMNGDGSRSAHQLCMTNDAVVRQVTENVRKILAENPGTGNIISVSKNDGGGACVCPKCKALDDAEGTHMASLLYLVNGVAEGIEKDYPDIVVSTLAYIDTVGVPKTMRPRQNVAIRVCTDTCMWWHPFTPARQSEGFAPMMKEWARVCKRIYIWDYNVNFSYYVAPMPNMDVIADNVRFFIENNAEGVMTQGAYQSPGGERDLMRSWVIAKLMWDPTRDTHELMRDFAWGHYENAGAAISAWDRLLRQTAEQHAAEMASPVGGIRYLMNDPFLSDELLEKGVQVFDIAEREARSEPVFKRVARARIPLMFVRLCRGPAWVGPAYPQLINRFEEVAHRVGLEFIAEVPEPDVDAHIASFRQKWSDYALALDPRPCIFVDTMKVALSTPLANGRIHYTLDGSTPTTESPVYRKPLTLDRSTTITALVAGDIPRESGAPIIRGFYERPPSGEGLVRYDYYEGSVSNVPDFSTEEPKASGVVRGFSLKASQRPGNYMIRFRGSVHVDKEGVYRFFTTSDDGSKLWVGDQLVVDNDGTHPPVEKSGAITLEPGWQPITVGFFQGIAGSALGVSIEGPDLPKRPLEGAMLRP